jgi:hypothetical protein
MKYLRLFENYSSLEFPDVFGDSLLRGVRIDKEEYIDDPKLRRVSIGDSNNEDYNYFLNNYKKLGLQNPTKSVHFVLNSNVYKFNTNRYGNPYKPIPEKNAKFSFNKELRNGGLGSTWWHVEGVLRDFTNLSKDDIEKYDKSFGHYDLYYDNIDEFNRLMNEYQKILIDNGVVGNLSYDELLDLANNSDETLQIWTESPVLHKMIKYDTEKKPNSYKNKPILTKQDFVDLDIDPRLIGDFYKEYSNIFKRFQNELDSKPERFDLIRQEALDMIKKWKNKI